MSPVLSCLAIAILSLALASTSPAAPAMINDVIPAVESPTVPLWTQFLQAHNDARAAAGVPPLAWNSTIALDAMLYARELRARCDLERLPTEWAADRIYGRNLFWGSGAQSGAAVTAAWVGEGRWYDRRANSCAPGKKCGAYAQVVWSGTRQLGCARVLCRDATNAFNTVAACEYFPPGNYAGN